MALIPAVSAELESLRSSPSSLVFASRAGTHLNLNNWRNRVWQPAVRAEGRDGLRPYDGRHTFASLLMEEGRNMCEVSSQLGHESATTTLKHYAHMFDESHGGERVSMADAVAGVWRMYGDGDVVDPRRSPQAEANCLVNRTNASTRGRIRTCDLWLRRLNPVRKPAYGRDRTPATIGDLGTWHARRCLPLCAGVFPKCSHSGSPLAAAGVDLVTIQAAMGHSVLATTGRYLHTRPASQQAAAFTRGFEPLPGGPGSVPRQSVRLRGLRVLDHPPRQVPNI